MKQSFISLVDLDIAGQRLLIREDLNVPIANGEVTSDARIRAAIPTLQLALERGARVIVMSHLGRPIEGVPIKEQPAFSMAPVARRLGELLEREVPVVGNWQESGPWQSEQLVILENVRQVPGEKANDPELARGLASLCDVFVMDAFATAHRAQASTHGVAEFAPVACAGPLLAAELSALARATADPARPVVAIVGGSKVSTKLELLGTLADKVDHLIVGGGIANTFLAAAGKQIGTSLAEPELLDQARELMARVEIPLPQDVVVADDISPQAEGRLKSVEDVDAGEMILDIGPVTSGQFGAILKDAGTILWNGPVGVFEHDQFGEGTRRLASDIAASSAFSIAGGGDTLAAIDKYDVRDRISYISTGGGAFLEYVEGKTLPAVSMLQQRFARSR